MDVTIRRAVARAADELHQVRTFDEAVEGIVRGAVQAFHTFDHIGVSIVENGGRIVTRAASTPLTYDLDAIQYDLHEGPWLDSLDTEQVVAAPRVWTDDRWPNYATKAADLGLRAQLAVRLHEVTRGTIGSINLYSTTTERVEDSDVDVLDLYAIHAAAALAHARFATTLQAGLASRKLIGQALGIIMERYTIDEGSAQAFLWRTSSHTNIKVRDIASSLVEHTNNPVVT